MGGEFILGQKIVEYEMMFSLIVCTYQRAEALNRLLATVAVQSLYPDEILIIDGSRDDNTKLNLSQQDLKNLSYYKVEDKDRGLTRQRNFGIEKLNPQTEIICFLDDDVVLEPDYFQNLIQTFVEKPYAIGVGGYITNEVNWTVAREFDKGWFKYDGFQRKEGNRFQLRAKFGLSPNLPPGFMPDFGHGRSIGFLPPSGKLYQVEQLMGGVAAYKRVLFEELSFSSYFEGYGLYEDADFSIRASKKGSLWINTKARLEHHHDPSGRPNLYKYGKMVIRNGWDVWRGKYPKPGFKARLKWNATALLLTLIRFSNVLTASDKKGAFQEATGRVIEWWSLVFNKPRLL